MRDKQTNTNLIKITGDNDILINQIQADNQFLDEIKEERKNKIHKIKKKNFKKINQENLDNNNIFNFHTTIGSDKINTDSGLYCEKEINSTHPTEFNSSINTNNSNKYFFLENKNNRNPLNKDYKDIEKTLEKGSKDIDKICLGVNNNLNTSDLIKSYKMNRASKLNSSFNFKNNQINTNTNKIETLDRETENNENSNINSNLNLKKKILPYKTIDCIFNKKNIWINLQTPHSDKIFYDIWNEEKWYPLNFLNKKENDFKSVSVNNKSKLEIRKQTNKTEKIANDDIENQMKNFLINMEDIPAFYNFKDFINPHNEEDLKNLRDEIMNCLKYSITTYRKEFNLITNIKNVLQIFI